MKNALILKNLVLTIILSFSLIYSSSAQIGKFQFAVKVGASASIIAEHRDLDKIYMDAPYWEGSNIPLIAPLGEITIGISLPEGFSVQSGISYTRKGGRSNYNYMPGHYDTRMYYGEIPVTLVKKFAIAKQDFYAGAGVYFARLIKDMPQDLDVYYSGYVDRFKRNDFGVKLAVGYMPFKRISLDAAYEIGATNILRIGYNNFLYNRSLSLGIGYHFK